MVLKDYEQAALDRASLRRERERNMTKSKKQQEEEARQQELVDDPGKSPSDVNKDTSAAAPVSATYEGSGPVSRPDDSKDK